MPHSRHGNFPLSAYLVIILCVAYSLFGLTAHEPWKTPDAVNIAVAESLSSEKQAVSHLSHLGDNNQTATWLAPTLAGGIWLESPPLYHWLAAQTGDRLSGWLPWHAAARLSSALFSLGGLFLLSIAARGFHGREASYVAPLLVLGSLGFLVPAHDAQPALIGFASLAGVMAALAWWEVRPGKSAIGMGLAAGLGFLGTGLDSLLVNLVVILTALSLPTWRRVSPSSWLMALLIAALLIAAWPLALWQVSPELFTHWWAQETQRSFTADVRRVELLFWGTWPVLPLALWGIWLHRYQLRTGRHFMPLIASLAALLLYFATDDTNAAILPLLAVLAILASAGAGRLRRGAASAFDWFGSITVTLFIGLIWLGGIAMLTGHPARVAKNFTRPAPNFVAELSWLAIGIALIATFFWLYLLVASPRSPWRGVIRWSAGVVCIWVTLVCLWMPWVDHGKSYRQLITTLQLAMPSKPSCIESPGVGDGLQASLDYFAGIRLVPSTENRCLYRLIQTKPDTTTSLPGWHLIKDVSRPGDRRERIRLYARTE